MATSRRALVTPALVLTLVIPSAAANAGQSAAGPGSGSWHLFVQDARVLRLVDPETLKTVTEVPLPEGSTNPMLDERAGRLYVLHDGPPNLRRDKRLSILDLRLPSRPRPVPIGRDVRAAFVTPGGEFIVYFASAAGLANRVAPTLTIVRTQVAEVVAQIPLPFEPSTLLATENGRVFALGIAAPLGHRTKGRGSVLLSIDAARGTTSGELRFPHHVVTMVVSADAKWLYLGDLGHPVEESKKAKDAAIHVVHVGSGRLVASHTFPKGVQLFHAHAESGRLLAVAHDKREGAGRLYITRDEALAGPFEVGKPPFGITPAGTDGHLFVGTEDGIRYVPSGSPPRKNIIPVRVPKNAPAGTQALSGGIERAAKTADGWVVSTFGGYRVAFVDDEGRLGRLVELGAPGVGSFLGQLAAAAAVGAAMGVAGAAAGLPMYSPFYSYPWLPSTRYEAGALLAPLGADHVFVYNSHKNDVVAIERASGTIARRFPASEGAWMLAAPGTAAFLVLAPNEIVAIDAQTNREILRRKLEGEALQHVAPDERRRRVSVLTTKRMLVFDIESRRLVEAPDPVRKRTALIVDLREVASKGPVMIPSGR